MSDELRDELAEIIAKAAYNDQGLSIRDDLRVADAILPIIARERTAAWDEGERHESEYLATFGQFCPNPENPYRVVSRG